MQLTRNFKLEEFACRCGCGFDDISISLVTALQTLRDRIGKPIKVTSGCRCKEHNKRVGGKARSTHLSGLAADIKIAGMTPEAVAAAAERIPVIQGIGIYPTFTHLDVRQGRARW